MFRKLRTDEIDVRVAKVNKFNISLLLYKDARADMIILDETVGAMFWKREHTRDNANCIVSIYNETIKEWISKEDTGTESYAEAEKGLASDSFKRACFNWGIGRELYTSPKINVNSNYANEGKCYEQFKVSKINYKNNIISELEIVDSKNKVAFKWQIEEHKNNEKEGVLSKSVRENEEKIKFISILNKKIVENNLETELKNIMNELKIDILMNASIENLKYIKETLKLI